MLKPKKTTVRILQAPHKKTKTQKSPWVYLLLGFILGALISTTIFFCIFIFTGTQTLFTLLNHDVNPQNERQKYKNTTLQNNIDSEDMPNHNRAQNNMPQENHLIQHNLPSNQQPSADATMQPAEIQFFPINEKQLKGLFTRHQTNTPSATKQSTQKKTITDANRK